MEATIQVNGYFIEVLNKFKIDNGINASRGAMLWKLLNFAQSHADQFFTEHFQGLQTKRYDRQAVRLKTIKAEKALKQRFVYRYIKVCVCGSIFEVEESKKKQKFCSSNCPKRHSEYRKLHKENDNGTG